VADQSILDKIGKLKRHAESASAIGNEAEAQAFAEMMQRLLAKHKISMTDIEFKEFQDSNPIANYPIDYSKYPDLEMRKSRQAWIERLAGIVSAAHNCRFAVYTKSSRLSLIGRKSEVEQCEFVLVVLQRFVERASDRARHEYYHQHVEEWRKTGQNVTYRMRGYRDNWIDSFVRRLGERYDDEAARLRREAAAGCVALVRVSDLKAVDDFVKGQSWKSASKLGPVARTAHADGMRHGRAAAEKVNLRSNALTAEQQLRLDSKRCVHCNEPEDGGDFGWFDHDTDGLVCQACGGDPKDVAKPGTGQRPRRRAIGPGNGR
jgi:hypothetical protein